MEGKSRYDDDKQALVRDLEHKDERAFNYLFRTRYKELCRFAVVFLDSYEDAEEVVQDLFVKLWTDGLRLKDAASLDSYLYVSVRNACANVSRRQVRHVGLEAAAGEVAESPKEEEDLSYVWKAVDALPEQCRAILKLVVIEEMKYAEVAEKLDVSINTVKTQMKIAYRELRQRLSPQQMVLLFLKAGSSPLAAGVRS